MCVYICVYVCAVNDGVRVSVLVCAVIISWSVGGPWDRIKTVRTTNIKTINEHCWIKRIVSNISCPLACGTRSSGVSTNLINFRKCSELFSMMW